MAALTVVTAREMRFDQVALARNLDMLLAALGKDRAWVAAQTEHAGVWVDRVLAQREEVCG